ncbi:hypothetical protein Rsl_1551 [Rickettsia slovaca 13-B]|uniref:Uncharacterized protein n=1 Tax=Rickettsia slovaca (strain 13-B) TaxID=941638 RepID=A0ABM5MQ83_RICS1|nr:hypothetical protein Rsl_1551 [Rickettsia slovaca 13-B]
MFYRLLSYIKILKDVTIACFFLYNSCESLLAWIGKSSLREELHSNSTKQSQEVCYYFTRLPRSLRLLAMTIWYLYKDSPSMTRKILMVPDIGFELMTYRLQGGCSTTELIRHINMIIEKRYVLSYPWLDHNI